MHHFDYEFVVLKSNVMDVCINLLPVNLSDHLCHQTHKLLLGKSTGVKKCCGIYRAVIKSSHFKAIALTPLPRLYSTGARQNPKSWRERNE